MSNPTFVVGEKVYIKANLTRLEGKTRFGIVTEVTESTCVVNPFAIPKFEIAFYPSELKKVN